MKQSETTPVTVPGEQRGTMSKQNEAIPEAWNSMKTVPMNASWFRLRVRRGGVEEEVRAHWASDMSGEEQPSFQGFFRDDGTGKSFVEVVGTPLGWLPDAPVPGEQRGDCACEGKIEHFNFHSSESCGTEPKVEQRGDMGHQCTFQCMTCEACPECEGCEHVDPKIWPKPQPISEAQPLPAATDDDHPIVCNDCGDPIGWHSSWPDGSVTVRCEDGREYLCRESKLESQIHKVHDIEEDRIAKIAGLLDENNKLRAELSRLTEKREASPKLIREFAVKITDHFGRHYLGKSYAEIDGTSVHADVLAEEYIPEFLTKLAHSNPVEPKKNL